MIIELTRPNLTYIVFKRKGIILGTALGLFGLALLYCLFATPQYLAQASLVVNFSTLPTGVPQAVAGGTTQTVQTFTPLDHEEIINTNIQELKSNDLARRVIAEVGVDKLYPPHASLNPLSYLSAAIESLGDEKGDPSTERELKLQQAVERFTLKDLDVRGEARSNIIHISVLNANRALAADVAQRLIDHFLEQETSTARNPRINFMRGQLKIYAQQAADAQAALQKIKADTNIYSLDAENTDIIQERSLTEQSLFSAHNDAVENKERYQELTKQLAHISPVLLTKQNDRDPLQLNARSNLAELQAREAKLRNTYAPDSQVMIDLRNRIRSSEGVLNSQSDRSALTRADPNTAYQQLQIALAQAKADYLAASESERAQQAQLAEINERFRKRSASEGIYRDAVRANDLADQNYRTYLQGTQQARVSEDLNKAKISSIVEFDSVFADAKPAKPRKPLILLLGLLGGLALGLSLALLAESMDQTFNTPAQIGPMLGLPVFGSLARI